MRVFMNRRDARQACLISVAVALFSVALLLWVLESGGYIVGSVIVALIIGTGVRYILDEPLRTRAHVRQRTLALQDLAYRDGLTGLPNRRFFNWYAERFLPRQLLKRQLLNGHANTLQCRVVLFDLNGFKAVNDVHGHEAGDALLKLIAETLNTYLPSDALLARLGGDEFVVLVRDRRQGRKVDVVVNRIRQAAGITMMFNRRRIQVSASIGVSSAVTGNPQLESMLREADNFMYEDKAWQKQHGLNQPLSKQPALKQAVSKQAVSKQPGSYRKAGSAA